MTAILFFSLKRDLEELNCHLIFVLSFKLFELFLYKAECASRSGHTHFRLSSFSIVYAKKFVCVCVRVWQQTERLTLWMLTLSYVNNHQHQRLWMEAQFN